MKTDRTHKQKDIEMEKANFSAKADCWIILFGRTLLIIGSVILFAVMLPYPSANTPGAILDQAWISVHAGESIAHLLIGLGILAIVSMLAESRTVFIGGLLLSIGMEIAGLFIWSEAFVFPIVASGASEQYTMHSLIQSGLLHPGLQILMYATTPFYFGGLILFGIGLILGVKKLQPAGWLLIIGVLLLVALFVVSGTPERIVRILYGAVIGGAMIWLQGHTGFKKACQ